jgi:hypothetical protein
LINKYCARKNGRRHLNKKVVSQGPYGKRKKLETGSMAVGANSSLVVVGKREMADDWTLDTLVN